MRKNGFTLIELLAVIVILAIIALIATPIILGIINDARQESQERSVELYASAVRNGIAAYQLREMKEVQAGTYTSETLPFDVEYDGEVECSTIDIYEDGGVYVAGCTVNDLDVDYTYGTKQIIKGKLSSICTAAKEQYFADSPLEAGYKYECDVDPEKQGYDYIFYVLNSTATEVNLIMDSNINISGNAVKGKESDLGQVEWITKADYTSEEIGGSEAGYGRDGNWNKGPITAMNYLASATKDWTNTNELTISTFTDDEGNTHPMTEYVVNARMPYYSEVTDSEYLYDNLHYDCWDEEGADVSCDVAIEIYGVFEEGIEHKLYSYGYWTLSSFASYPDRAWAVNYGGGGCSSENVNYGVYNGVRPVINLSI